MLLNSLATGKVFRRTVHCIHVGRRHELEELATDNEVIATGGSSARLVAGDAGWGKTHLRYMHTDQSALQNVVTAHVHADELGFGGFADAFSLQIWQQCISSIECGNCKGLSGIVDAIRRTNGGIRVNSESCSRFGPAVPVNGFDILLNFLHLASEDDDMAVRQYAFSWLFGATESYVEAVKILGVLTLMEDASWVDRLAQLACVLRTFGYAGLLVQVENLDAWLMDGCLDERIRSLYKLLRLIDDCDRNAYPGLGFVFYIENSTARMIETESDFRSGYAPHTRGMHCDRLKITALSALSSEEIRSVLKKVGHLCVLDSEISRVLRSSEVEKEVDWYLNRVSVANGPPGPFVSYFVRNLMARAYHS